MFIQSSFFKLDYQSGTSATDLILNIEYKIGTAEYDQHRTVSLMSHLTKVMLRVLMNRMRKTILPEIS